MNELVSKLCRAELITHLLEIDEETASEKEAAACVLNVLDAQVFRIAPYLYGVNLSSMTDATDAERVENISEALTARLGPGSVGVTTLILDPQQDDAATGEVEENTLLLMQAVATAADQVTSEDGPERGAILSAEFAVRAAELTARGLAELAVSAPPAGEEIAPALEATTNALHALELRLDHLELRFGEISEASREKMQDWADSSLLKPLRDVESQLAGIRSVQSETIDDWGARIGTRLDTLEQGQIPAEWFLGQIMSRIGDLDEQLSGNEQEQRQTALEWARRLDSRISAVADQLIPPEWFLGRVMARIGELDQQLSSSQRDAETAAIDWAERLDDRVTTISGSLAPPEWLVGRIIERIDALEVQLSPAEREPHADRDALMSDFSHKLEPLASTIDEMNGRLAALVTREPATEGKIDTPQIAELALSHERLNKSFSKLKTEVSTLAKRHTQSANETSKSLDLIRCGLAEILAQIQIKNDNNHSIEQYT